MRMNEYNNWIVEREKGIVKYVFFSKKANIFISILSYSILTTLFYIILDSKIKIFDNIFFTILLFIVANKISSIVDWFYNEREFKIFKSNLDKTSR